MCRGPFETKVIAHFHSSTTLPYVSEIGMISSLDLDSYSKIYLSNTCDTSRVIYFNLIFKVG